MKSKIVRKDLAYLGRVCRVYKVGVQMPDGKVVDRDLVEYSGATVIVPVLPDGRVVIIRNERFAVNEELYEFPAGMIDAGENPAMCAARELTEETGYTAGKLVPLGGFFTGPGSSSEYIHAFLATDLTLGRPGLEDYEAIRTETVTQTELEDMIATGKLHDAKSISAWTLRRLREQRK